MTPRHSDYRRDWRGADYNAPLQRRRRTPRRQDDQRREWLARIIFGIFAAVTLGALFLACLSAPEIRAWLGWTP